MLRTKSSCQPNEQLSALESSRSFSRMLLFLAFRFGLVQKPFFSTKKKSVIRAIARTLVYNLFNTNNYFYCSSSNECFIDWRIQWKPAIWIECMLNNANSYNNHFKLRLCVCVCACQVRQIMWKFLVSPVPHRRASNGQQKCSVQPARPLDSK